MRSGGSNFKDASAIPDNDAAIQDWLNLPAGANTVSLWCSLHDAYVISIRSNLLERTMDLSCEIWYLNRFHKLGEEFQFILQLLGVQSARALRYAVWPGESPVLDGLPIEEQRRLVAEYQAKWREESASWNEFESQVTQVDEQIFDISDAALTNVLEGRLALKLCGHLNHATYHEAYLRFAQLRIVGSDGRQFRLEEFLRLGEAYWEAFSRGAHSTT